MNYDARKIATKTGKEHEEPEEGYDVTIETLQKLVEVIKAQWAGPHKDRIKDTRCGTIYLKDDKMGFKLDLRFPFDEETWLKLIVGEKVDLDKLWK